MKKAFLFIILTVAFIGVHAQEIAFGPVTVPSNAKLMSEVKDDIFTGFTPDYPNPNLYYYETDGKIFIYIVSLKSDKTYNGITVIRINTTNIAPGNFMAEAVSKTDYTVVNIYTKSKIVMETFTFFEFNIPAGDPTYEYALQMNINVIDKAKADELVNLLNAKQKK